jgi:hypothetical protein
LLTSEMNKVAEQAEKLANIIVADIRISQKWLKKNRFWMYIHNHQV